MGQGLVEPPDIPVPHAHSDTLRATRAAQPAAGGSGDSVALGRPGEALTFESLARGKGAKVTFHTSCGMPLSSQPVDAVIAAAGRLQWQQQRLLRLCMPLCAPMYHNYGIQASRGGLGQCTSCQGGCLPASQVSVASISATAGDVQPVISFIHFCFPP